MQSIVILMLTLSLLFTPSNALITKFLLMMVISSLVASILIYPISFSGGLSELFWYIYTSLGLIFLIFPLNGFKSQNKGVKDFNTVQYAIIKVFLLFGLLCFVINAFIFYQTLSQLLSGNLDIVEFKNGGETQLKLKQYIPPILLSYTNYISGIGFLALGLHFHFLIKGNSRLYIFLTLIVALNIPFYGLQALSRAFTVIFILLYFFSLLFIINAIPIMTKKMIIRVAFLGFIGVLTVFLAISYNRFGGDKGHYTIKEGSLIDDPMLFSLLDYFTQWVKNGVETLSKFELGVIWSGKSFMIIVDRFKQIINDDLISYVDLRYETLGEYASKFNGVISTLTYDFSPIGLVAFLILFKLFSLIVSSNNSIFIKNTSLLLLPYFLCIPVMFFMNNFFVYLSLQIGLIFTVLLLLCGRIKV